MINSLQLGKLPELEDKSFGAFKQKLIPSLNGAFTEIPGKPRMKLPHRKKDNAINY